jgi:hypothetical protein
MKSVRCLLACSIPVLALIAAGPADGRKGTGGGAQVILAVVPEYLFNVVLGRPGADSITASLLGWKDGEAFLSYGEKPETLDRQTAKLSLVSGEPQSVVLGGLKPGTRYFYQATFRTAGGELNREPVHSFQTQRSPEAAFTFDVQADSHLDVATDPKLYQQTLANVLADQPDFLIDLGDTTMVDKFGQFFTVAKAQYLAQRYYLGQIAHSVPLFLTLGNHDGEQGSRLNGQPDSMPLWSVRMRKKYFPNPEPNDFYSGNATPQEGAGLLQDYYAWEWGGALFVVLDPFWPTRERKSDDNWGMTLGEEQYRWLARTLKNSRAPFKFIFIHHLVGGLTRDVRGGVAAAPFLEWGGKNADGTDGFAAHRPIWEKPIHALLVENGVSVVFHGHDHLFAREELDGVVYQEVPQPSHPNAGTRSAQEYGYTGVILGNSGHLRVRVESGKATIDYVVAGVPELTRDVPVNGAVAHRYTISPRLHPTTPNP